MKMNLNEYLIDEFQSPEYDREFINDLVNNYSGDINPNEIGRASCRERV